MKHQAKIRVRISVATVCFYVALLIFEPSAYTFLPLLAAALHEGGHLCVMLLVKRRVDAIRIYPFGVDIHAENGNTGYYDDLAVALAGVAVNLLAFLFCLPHLSHSKVALFAGANLLLFFVNLFPIQLLDGGEALYILLLLHFAPDTAQRHMRRISFCAVVILWIVATYFFLCSGYNFSLFAMAVYLFACMFLRPCSSQDYRG